MLSRRASIVGSSHYHSGPNMTPLVDVVMVILIFLMLAGSFGSGERFLATTVPLRRSGIIRTDQPIPLTMPRMVEVFVQPNGNFTVGGQGGVMLDPAQLKSSLEAKAVQFGSSSDIEIILRPSSGDVPWDVLAGLYDAAVQAHFHKICFAAAPGAG